jgi:hypothetical protein
MRKALAKAATAIAVASMPAMAGAQTATKFDLVCTTTFSDHQGGYLSSGQERYSVDFEKGLACLQTSSGVSNNQCRGGSKISMSGDSITFVSYYPVTINIVTGVLYSKKVMGVSRGTCVRAPFTTIS